MRLFVILVIVIFVFIGTCFCAIPLILKHLNSHINCNDCGCTRADRTLLKSANHQFAADLENCGIKAWGNGEKASECLKSLYPNLSTGCANCFGEFVNCSRDHCKWACLSDPRSSKCSDCASEHCSAALVTCTGLAATEIPSI